MTRAIYYGFFGFCYAVLAWSAGRVGLAYVTGVLP